MAKKKQVRGKSKAINIIIIISFVILILLFVVYYHIQNGGRIEFLDHFLVNEDYDNYYDAVGTSTDEPKLESFATEMPISDTETSISEAETDISASETDISTEEPDYLPHKPDSPTDYDKEFFIGNLFIGDSIITGLIHYNFVPPEFVFAKVGMNGYSIMTQTIPDVSDPNKTEKTALEKVAELKPPYVFIMLGANSVGLDNNETMIKQMNSFIDAVKEASPNSEIALISITPVTAKYESEKTEKMPAIIEYNQMLQEVAGEKGCYYVDVFSELTDETDHLALNFAENDGVHLNISAYPVILSKIQSELT